MAFIRKKSDRPTRIKTYKFRIYPENQLKDFLPEIKDKIFEQSRLMNAFWNRLVEIRRATLEALSIIRREELDRLGHNGEPGKRLLSKDIKKLSPAYQSRSLALWQSYEQQVKAAATDEESARSLDWEAREDVFNRFDSVHRRNLKNGGEIKMLSNYIQRFHFPHRFTGGGRAAPLIHTGRSKKLFIESIPAVIFESESYRHRLRRVASGRFGVGVNDCLQIPFRIVMHRPIPETAMIKQAIFTGRFKNRGWEYFLVLTTEDKTSSNAPQAITANGNAKAIAGLDLGWRKFDDYIRFGVIADSNGNLFELRLPHRLEKQQSLRRLERLLAKHGVNSPAYPQTWQDIEDWQQANDIAAVEVKQAIKRLNLPRTEITSPILDEPARVGKNGLLRLLGGLEKTLAESGDELHPADVPDGEVIKAVNFLTSWRDTCFAREKAINYCRDRLINYRNHHYQLLARWLRENYAQIALVADLFLQKVVVEAANVSRLEANGSMRRNAAKYRNRVALSELLRRIREKQGDGADGWLYPVKDKKKNTRCLTCGESSSKTSQLIAVCRQGHRHDRDIQDAVNLRNNLSVECSGSLSDIKIPDHLKNIIAIVNNSDIA